VEDIISRYYLKKKEKKRKEKTDRCSIQKYTVNYNTLFCKCSINSSNEKHKGKDTTVWVIHTAVTKTHTMHK
jgi:hypothetical protein